MRRLPRRVTSAASNHSCDWPACTHAHKCQVRDPVSGLCKHASAAGSRSSNAGGQLLALYMSQSRHASGINRRPISPRLCGSVEARSRCRPAAQTPAETCVCAWLPVGPGVAHTCAFVCVRARALACVCDDHQPQRGARKRSQTVPGSAAQTRRSHGRSPVWALAPRLRPPRPGLHPAPSSPPPPPRYRRARGTRA